MTKRDAIIELYRAGTIISKIIKQLKVPKSTVYDAVRRYKELGNTKDRPKNGRPRSFRTKRNIKAVRERVRRNPKRSMRKMALDFKMDPKSMRTIVKTHLKLSPLKLKKRQHLTVLQKRKRAERAGLLWICWNLTRRRVKSFFQTKNCSLWRRNSIHKTTECWPDIQKTFLKTC